MTLSSGTKLGPYEIVATIGAGGMGEVYRAKDPRLKRDVAIKVLPSSVAADADRLRRFETEAQTAGGLNHPNITAVYELGSHDGAPYIVQELLEGETLRSRLAGGPLPVRKATEYAIQTARGLAAAHEKGIVHRDLKPENLFVTNDGRVKILDFGLAKLTQADGAAGPQTNLPTATKGTEPGVVMGTLGYMSPEQVKGKQSDARSDIFSFGAILYEMLSGARAFSRETAAETMSAILREDPPDLSATNKNVQPGLERVVRHCLEKSPEERFHSAHDLAFDLEALSGTSPAGAVAAAPARRLRVRALPALLAVLLAALAAAGGYLAGTRRAPSTQPSFKQLTFRKGPIWSARFGSDGKSVLYSAAWDGKPEHIYLTRPDSPESSPFGVPGSAIRAVSPSGELAVALRSDRDGPFTRAGTLARAAASGGGAPRELLERVQYADWTPDGKDLLVVRNAEGKTRLEFPVGRVLYETTGWIDAPRFSPKGDRIAFVDHPILSDDGGTIAVVNLAGKKTPLTGPYATASGSGWSPDGSEVWFTAADVGANRSLIAAAADGSLRTHVLARAPGTLSLLDVSRDGRALVSRDMATTGIVAMAPGADREADLTWLDWSLFGDFSRDGRTIVFSETGEGGGAGYSAYIRGTDGSPAIRLGQGSAIALSEDGKSVLALIRSANESRMVIYPTGAGETRPIKTPGLNPVGGRFLPDGRILLMAAEPGKRRRWRVLDPRTGAIKPLPYEGYRFAWVAPDGQRFGSLDAEGRSVICTVDGEDPRAIPGFEPADTFAGWSSDGASVYVRRGSPTTIPARIDRVSLSTGRAEPFREIYPPDVTGVTTLHAFEVAQDGRSYAYGYTRMLSTLFVMDGLTR